jgi:hypothetical protein
MKEITRSYTTLHVMYPYMLSFLSIIDHAEAPILSERKVIYTCGCILVCACVCAWLVVCSFFLNERVSE